MAFDGGLLSAHFSVVVVQCEILNFKVVMAATGTAAVVGLVHVL